ncbi:hypothetical protein WR25_01091 isoform B [Diploscapter pachys]|uniref:Uncharacterized protein n=1 Tax=Diploscapter pachys TaxID=2018661 RepID=A0A2A2J3B7_9BILA|nr:hypothetical protein WR25_01091 isoform A [Diploscapter pachys]PAV56053.1 hypothetical protein WR25_01091 isoform B [Diploscapter pachys]
MYGEMDVPSTSSPMKPSRFPNLTYDNPSQLEPFLSQCNQYGCQTQFINDDLYVLIEVSKAMGYDNFYQPFMRMSLMIYHEPMSADVATSPNLCNLATYPAYCHILQGADENYNGATFFEAICSVNCECDSGWYCSRDVQSGNIVGGSYWLVLMPTSYKYTKCENSTLATPIYFKDMTFLLATLGINKIKSWISSET